MKKLILALLFLLNTSFALTPDEEKQLLKYVAEIKATLKLFMEQTKKRFEHVDKRFEDMNHKIEMIVVFMGIPAGLFASITALTIGFAIWDRRTMVRPFEDKIKEVDEELAQFLRERNLL